MRDVGEMGESTLKIWASQVGISANKASQDKTGWDFLLEFPLTRDTLIHARLPLDKDPFPLKCFIQVKSSDQRPGKWPVKLDNWVRFVKSPLPAFFLILEFDSQNTCQQAYLVHVGEEYIRRVLKKLRETEVGKRGKLHKRTMQVSYSEIDILPSLTGEGLEQAIRKHLGGSTEEYAKKKMELVETVGYEDGYGTLRVSIALPEHYRANIQEYLVDFSLGLVPQLQVTHGTMTDTRFGLAAPEPTETLGEGAVLEVTNRQTGKAVIVLRTPDDKSELRFNTDVYLPQGVDIRSEYYKFRLAAPFVNMVIWPNVAGKGRLDFNLPDPTQEYDLKSLQVMSSLILFLHNAIQSHRIIGFEVMINSLTVTSGSMNLDEQLHESMVLYATVVDHAWKISKYFDVHQDIKLKPVELLRQQDQLTLMSMAVTSTRGVLRLTFWSKDEMPDDEKDFCVPLVTHVFIGPFHMIVGAAILGRLNMTGEIMENSLEFEVQPTRMEVRRKYLYDRETPPKQSVQGLKDAINEDFSETHHILDLKD